MKAKRKAPEKAAPVFSLKPWHVAAGLLVALVMVIEAYGPALNGPFLFDDQGLPIYSHDFGERPWFQAIRGARPFLMLSFWINHRLSQLEPYSYHLLNVLLHLANSLLVFFIVRKMLELANTEMLAPDPKRREILAAFAAGVFLLHPVQTESVAYVASRSETLSILFFYSAFALFVRRIPAPVSWPATAGVLLLFGAAVTTKQHTAVLPALLLLTDYFWNPGFSFTGIRRNWRLYVPLVVAGALGLRSVWNLLRHAPTAGFGMKDLSWLDYFFTQCRAIWVYFRLYVFPVGQNADYDYPISHSVLDHGAIVGLIGLLVLAAAALYFRRRFKLASYGVLVTLLLLAPTSSVVPIRDAVAERRLYLPMIGLLLITVGLLRRWRTSKATMAGACAAVLLLFGVLTHQRAKVWRSETAFWEDVIEKSPRNARAHFQLALAYYEEGRCSDAFEQYGKVARLRPPDHDLLVDWALAEDCLGRPAAALGKLQKAAALRPTAHVYAMIGMMHGKQGRREEALRALNSAIEINPRYDMTYVYLGNLHVVAGDLRSAAAEYRRALERNPNNQFARESLLHVETQLRRVR